MSWSHDSVVRFALALCADCLRFPALRNDPDVVAFLRVFVAEVARAQPGMRGGSREGAIDGLLNGGPEDFCISLVTAGLERVGYFDCYT